MLSRWPAGIVSNTPLGLAERTPYISSSQHWMTEIQPFVQNYAIFRCPTAPDIKDGYSGLNLGYGMNCYNFLDGYSSFWYGPHDTTIQKTCDTLWMADCQATNPGCYWVGSGSTFSEPVPYVDYRHEQRVLRPVL